MIDPEFGNWLAGFVDGEGCFYITKDSERGVWRARFSLTLRSDDRPILEEIQRVVGVGTLHNYKAQSGSVCTRWMVQSRPDCERLVEVFNEFTLRAKKLGDFLIWERAVAAQKQIRSGLADNSAVKEEMFALKQELAEERQKGVQRD